MSPGHEPLAPDLAQMLRSRYACARAGARRRVLMGAITLPFGGFLIATDDHAGFWIALTMVSTLSLLLNLYDLRRHTQRVDQSRVLNALIHEPDEVAHIRVGRRNRLRQVDNVHVTLHTGDHALFRVPICDTKHLCEVLAERSPRATMARPATIPAARVVKS